MDIVRNADYVAGCGWKALPGLKEEAVRFGAVSKAGLSAAYSGKEDGFGR